MSKKFKNRKELEETVHQKPDEDSCSFCGTHFFGSGLTRDSHFMLYPSHLAGGKPSVQEQEAAPQNLVPRIKKAAHRDC